MTDQRHAVLACVHEGNVIIVKRIRRLRRGLNRVPLLAHYARHHGVCVHNVCIGLPIRDMH